MNAFAAIAIVIQCIYIIAMDWIFIPGWNENITQDSMKSRLASSLWHGSMGVLFAIGQMFGIRWLMIIGAVWFTILLLLEINNWWIPYLFGIFKGEIDQDTFVRHYSRNFGFLPPVKDHVLVPDAQHIVMELITIVVIMLSFASLFCP